MTLIKPVPTDRSKINMHSPNQVRASTKLNISPGELAKVIETVGDSAAEVRKSKGLGAGNRSASKFGCALEVTDLLDG